jgi:hypothetical protein
LSGPAVADSISRDAYLPSAANLDKLFANAIEPWSFELNPDKNNENVKEVYRLYTPLEYKGKIIPVKITVKEMKSETEGKRIYSIEAIDVKMKNPGACSRVSSLERKFIILTGFIPRSENWDTSFSVVVNFPEQARTEGSMGYVPGPPIK